MTMSSESSAINFSEEVRQARLGPRQLLVILVLGMLVLLDGMDTQMLGMVAHDLTRDLGLPISTFGIVFSSGLLGALIGALALSPLADRFIGRKTMAIWAMGTASIATIATPFATGLGSLLVIRIVAGIGLGAALPSIFTLVSEFSPKRYARGITSSLVAFMPLGSFVGGVIARAVVPDFGWQMLLYVGGGMTLVLTVIAARVLPESVYFLLRIRNDPARAGVAARKLLPGLPAGSIRVDEDEPSRDGRQPVRRLFSDGFWKFTLLVWVAYIINQGILYFVLSWTPALLKQSGMATTAGMDAAATFGIGGAIGTAAQGWLATRFNLYRLMLVEMMLFLVAMISLPLLLGDPVLAPAVIFFVAFGICAFHAGFILIVVESYPNAIRTTGFGWALGIGRIGATAAPVLAGALVAAGWSAGQIFVAAAIPGAVSALALIGISFLLRDGRGPGDKHRTQELAPMGAQRA